MPYAWLKYQSIKSNQIKSNKGIYGHSDICKENMNSRNGKSVDRKISSIRELGYSIEWTFERFGEDEPNWFINSENIARLYKLPEISYGKHTEDHLQWLPLLMI